MSESLSDFSGGKPVTGRRGLKFLKPQQVEMIDEALSALDEYGEVRLVVEKGRLRFVITQRSYDALKWQPGSLKDSDNLQAGDA